MGKKESEIKMICYCIYLPIPLLALKDTVELAYYPREPMYAQ